LNALVIFRSYENEVIALFPELPGSRKPRECRAFTLNNGFYATDYEKVMFHSRPAKTRDYRSLLDALDKLDFPVNIIQKASPIMHERRQRASKTYEGN
jgi:hypothetical protein